MRRTIPPTTRGVLEIDWPFFGELCRALALKVARDYDPEVGRFITKDPQGLAGGLNPYVYVENDPVEVL